MDPDISKTTVDLRKGAESAFESFRKFCVKALDPENVTGKHQVLSGGIGALHCYGVRFEKLSESYDKVD